MDKFEIQESFWVRNKFLISEATLKITYITKYKTKAKIYGGCSSQLYNKPIIHQETGKQRLTEHLFLVIRNFEKV